MKFDIVTAGRIVGVLIIFVGIALSIWDATEAYPGAGMDFRWRFFLTGVLGRTGQGMLVILAAEIADRLWRNPSDPLTADAGEAAIAADE